MSDEIISKSLGIEHVEETKLVKVEKPARPDNANDYEYARKNLYDIIEKGHSALEDIVDIARQSESARAFEVVTNLIKTLAETNKDLLELAKQKKELDKEERPVENHVTNNNLNITSADLLKLIKGNSDNV